MRIILNSLSGLVTDCFCMIRKLIFKSKEYRIGMRMLKILNPHLVKEHRRILFTKKSKIISESFCYYCLKFNPNTVNKINMIINCFLICFHNMLFFIPSNKKSLTTCNAIKKTIENILFNQIIIFVVST